MYLMRSYEALNEPGTHRYEGRYDRTVPQFFGTVKALTNPLIIIYLQNVEFREYVDRTIQLDLACISQWE